MHVARQKSRAESIAALNMVHELCMDIMDRLNDLKAIPSTDTTKQLFAKCREIKNSLKVHDGKYEEASEYMQRAEELKAYWLKSFDLPYIKVEAVYSSSSEHDEDNDGHVEEGSSDNDSYETEEVYMQITETIKYEDLSEDDDDF